MIVRRWSADATEAGADAYQTHFSGVVLPELSRLDGFRGALVMREDAGENRVRLTDLTFWESLAAIHAFSGPEVTTAVVDDVARTLLLNYDKTTTHATILIDTRGH